jgi:hypothetical protein
MQSTIIKYFAFVHLPPHLQVVSKPIGELANLFEQLLPDGPEKSAGMRKLLEAKDCFVRSALDQAPNVLIEEAKRVRIAIDVDSMVNRFLGWKLPEDFYPDCGITFDGRKPDALNPNKSWPTGTNLFHAGQAKAMFEHALGGAATGAASA